VLGGGDHKEDRIISVRVLVRRCLFARPRTHVRLVSQFLVADPLAAESVRCSYAEEEHAACERAGEYEKRSAAAAARELRRAARRGGGGDGDSDDGNDNDGNSNRRS